MSDSENVNYIIYADDDPDDQDVMRELLPQIVPGVQLIIKESGEELLYFLNELPASAETPVLIILDLNMPTWDGIQTLSMVKLNERFQDVPVIIFSTTSNEADRDRAFLAGAVAFVTKPSTYSELKTIIGSFRTYFKS
jgi:CheY-like chemotaxis protein